jgi:hypothetical protein
MPTIKDIFLSGPERLRRRAQPIIKDISRLLWPPARLRIRVPPLLKGIALLKWRRPQRRRPTMRPAKLKAKPASFEPTIASTDAVHGSPRPGKLQHPIAITDDVGRPPKYSQIAPHSPIGSTEAVRENPNTRRVKLQSIADSTDAVRESNASQREPQSRIASSDAIRGRTKFRQRIPARPLTAKFLTRVMTGVAYWRKLITAAPRPAPREHEFAAIKPKDVKGRRIGTAGAFAIAICFALLVLCGIFIPVLLMQIRDMKTDITLLKMRLGAVDAHFNRLETQQKTKEAKAAETPPPPPTKHVQMTLSNDEIKLIRGSIKVVPAQPGAEQKVQLGQEISASSTVPVPASVVGQIAKLHGARFLVDDNGAIVISGEGSNHADVVIEPQ